MSADSTSKLCQVKIVQNTDLKKNGLYTGFEQMYVSLMNSFSIHHINVDRII